MVVWILLEYPQRSFVTLFLAMAGGSIEGGRGFAGGAQGVVPSRSYSEMKPENLRGAGVALEQLKLV